MIIDTLSSGVAKIPDFEVSQLVFLIKQSPTPSANMIQELVTKIKEQEMAPFYQYLTTELKLKGLTYDESLYNELSKANVTKITELKEKIEKLADDDEGELEILKFWTELSEYYAAIGDRVNALATLKKTIELAPSTGSKIDLLLTITRLGFFYDDKVFTKKYLDEANALIEKGGDWERRNRYKTYLGIYLMATRSFGEASKLLIDSLSTFTSTEISTYEQVAQYSLICGAISLDRPSLKQKLIESPEILAISSTTTKLDPILNLIKSLYFCDYKSFFPSLIQTFDLILTKDKYLHSHASFYLRELRCRAYAQLLESYKSLSLKSMADNFGVSVEFLDADLCRFIPNKKLNCVIDKVNGIVETNRPDNKNSQYHLLIKNGDALLTKLQRYGAAVRLSGAEKV
ncbi:hypothetical protein CANARDRAFT_5190 [[Candida] arabinofermentans NRRL YB-2248]|uniref:PCI domain-containing protein n=1 Tax=[Candida] arabinofermentans NRRL YB-2248 TaxID=983967 RepID=A0A1E4T7Y7_9ASCO|nr:hypothetical protein CANARDRAFT_5190 [[Candida] arabinofermentans NRRL YB-2248]